MGSTIRACSVMLLSDLDTTSLNLFVYLINCSWTVNRFQSLRMDYSKLLKKSSNSPRRLSRMKRMWLRRLTLCLRSEPQIDWFSRGFRS